MNEDVLREKIYEFLGLEIGSLSSESGNDWERAKKEVLDDYKREQLKNISENKEINLKTIDKKSDEFQSMIKSSDVIYEHKREHISQRLDLDDNEITILIQNSSKEILLNLVRNYQLNELQINSILDKSVYLIVKNILEKQTLTDSNIENILSIMDRNKSMYSDLYQLVERKNG